MANSNTLNQQGENRAGIPLSKVITRIIWLCMLPLFFFAGGISIHEIVVVHLERVNQAVALAEDFVLSTDNALNTRINALGILAGSPLMDDENRWQELYEEAQVFFRIFGTHVVISDGGTPIQLLLNTRVPFGTDLPVVKQPKGRMAGPIAMRTGKPAVSDLFEGPVANKPLVGIAVPVLREGRPKYAVLTTLDKKFFQKELDKGTYPTGWSMVLRDAQRNTIASNAAPPVEDPIVSRMAESALSGWTVTVEISSGPYWRSLLLVGVWLGGILLGVTLSGFLAGKWAGRRLGAAMASLTQHPAPDTLQPDIQEFATARRLLDEEMQERTAAENALRQTAEQLDKRSRELDAILSSVQDYVYILDPDGRFIFANKRLLDLWSLSADQATGKTMRELGYPEIVEAALLEGVRRVLKTGEVVINTTQYVSPTGIEGYYENVLAPMYGRDGRIESVAGSSRNITERKAAETELQRITRQRQLALDAACMGWWHYDPITRIASWDDRYKEIFDVTGYSRPNDEILSRLHPDDLPGVWSKVEAALDADDPEPYFAEYRIILPDGSIKWIEAHGIASFETIDGRKQAASFVGTVADITGRKNKEQALKDSDQRFRLALRNAPVSVAAQNRDLKYIWAYNQRTARPDEIVGHFDRDIFTAEEADYMIAIKRRVMENNVEHHEQIWLDRPSGRIFLDINWEPVHDESGQVVGVASATVNLTPIKLAEEALRASLDEKEVLLKEIHHRVKNNMQVISSLVDLQADEAKDPSMLGIFQDVIHRVRSMAMVHEKLYQSSDLSRVEFADYVKDLLGYLSRAMGTAAAGILLETNLEPVYLPVNAAVPCGLILNELFSNALKHAFKGRAGGKVSVALHEDGQRRVHLSVTDNGIGLPPGVDLECSRSLGLRIVRILSQQLHAKVEIRNVQGTQFMVVFEKKDPQHEPNINSHH